LTAARGTRADAGFGASHAVLQAQVDAGLLAGVSAAVWRHGTVVDQFCTGWADLERGQPLRPDHIHRGFSNTKLVTAVLVLGLVDEGVLALDAPLRRWLPAFGALRVMRPGARAIDDTEPLARDITLRHLLSHQAGFGHGVFDPGSPLYRAYAAAEVLGPQVSLAQQAERLAALPLAFQPGEGWEYSFAPDLLARAAEVATGQRFGALLQERVFTPLGMADTGFVLRPEQRPRLAALYRGHRDDPLKPGLKRLDTTPWPDAYQVPVARESAAGGLFTAQADMLALLGALLSSGGAGADRKSVV
jgi:CubicO group peptidase (beta-lactamase class C family)